MAEITGAVLLRHLRSEASSHVLLFRRARLRRSGRGLSFWFSPFAASLAELPLDDREVAIAVHGRSSDFQDLVVQGNLSYRIVDPARAAARVDFTIDPRRGTHIRQPLEKLGLALTQIAQQGALSYLQGAPLRELVLRGHDPVRRAVEDSLRGASLLVDLGLDLVSVHVASVKPAPEIERALEAPTRERVQEAADEATFRRRAQAVEKERAIQENEMQNQIELARREEQLIDQHGQNARRDAAEKAEAERIGSEAQAARTRIAAEARAAAVRAVTGARVALERERVDVYRTIPPGVLAGLAAQELAGKLPHIEHLNITPDLLGPLLGGLVDAGKRRLERPEPEGDAR